MLIVSLLVGAFALVASATAHATDVTNSVEWSLFVGSLLVLTPGALVVGRQLAQRVDAVGGPDAVAALAMLSAVGILGVLVIARVNYAAEDRSVAVLLPLSLLWAGGVVVLSGRALRGETIGEPLLSRRIGPLSPWLGVVFLLFLTVLAFFPPRFFHVDQLAASVLIAAGLVVAHERWARAAPAWKSRLLDVAVVVLVVMTVTDLSGHYEYIRPDANTLIFRDGNPIFPEVLGYFHRFHQDLWLATLNDMEGGRTLLVDTTSQYGAGVMYFLSGYFEIAPLGYGALGLLTGFLTGLQFALAYGVLRLAGVRRMLAVPAIAAAVLGFLMGFIGSWNDYPSGGALRFGIPWLIVLLTLVAALRPQHHRALWIASGAVVGLAAVWSFETFAYAALAFTTAAAFDAACTHPGRRWIGVVIRRILNVAALCVALYALLVVATRIVSGSWPDPSEYLAYLSVYSSGVNLLYGAAAPWAGGLPMLLVHFTSLLCLCALVARRHEIVVEHRPALAAIVATNGLGIGSLTYWVGNSAPETVFLLGLPVVVVATLWLSVATAERASMPTAFRLVALAAGLWFAATLGISGWDDTRGKWRRTALAHALPFGGAHTSLPNAVSKLWNNPVSDPRAPAAVAMLDRHFPPGAPALVLMEAELTVETLVRSRRINVLPIGDAEQTTLVSDEADPKVIETVDALRPGTLMLTRPAIWDWPAKESMDYNDGLVRIQRLALDRIRVRFELPIVEQGPHGLAIVRLTARI